jgi:hypothetical protein
MIQSAVAPTLSESSSHSGASMASKDWWPEVIKSQNYQKLIINDVEI